MSEDRFLLSRGVHTISIYPRTEFNGQKFIIIDCTDDDTMTMDMDGEWDEQHSSACYMVSDIIELQQIINSLESLKQFLK
jgi:hypothetical protein